VFSVVQKIELWDIALGSVREYFRGTGAREVSTNCRSPEVAIEPFIEPISASGQWLLTSPELPMKRLLGAGSASIFQIAHVFRGGEIGDHHREEFHLCEWYRVRSSLRQMQLDVETIVIGLSAALQREGFRALDPPEQWESLPFLDLYASLGGVRLRGDESAEELAPEVGRLATVSGEQGSSTWLEAIDDDEARCLAAWTELFSRWSDQTLDPWLANRSPTRGLHLVDFPAPLAALAETNGALAHRFESYWGGVELANCYRELSDPLEQRRRFERVNEVRRAFGGELLPLPQLFLNSLEKCGLPEATCGAAMGLERTIGAVLRASLCDIVLES
jgi:lysyl-tRNA synthetase class 2